ncbi:hypothetical protein BC940DRAFT_294752 [Gongronella butleri]|nr:hypothetical protein BC940DRAFT_294752 [Gongronella butleri]
MSLLSSPVTLDKLTPDLLLHIAQFLDVRTILNLSLTCKQLSSLVNDEHLFRRLVERDYHLTYKATANTWRAVYQGQPENICPHLGPVPEPLPPALHHPQKHANCDVCHTAPVSFLSLDPEKHNQVCTVCAQKQQQRHRVNAVTERAAVLYNFDAGGLYCFQCLRPVGKQDDNINERDKTARLLEQLTPTLPNGTIDDASSPPSSASASSALPSASASSSSTSITQHTTTTAQKSLKAAAPSADDIAERRKIEHFRYIQELRLEDMSLTHYLIEKTWSRNWMMFRTRDGVAPPGPITNYKLARNNGQLDPELRLPFDKYRPAPETHADIISEQLWTFLVDTYGLEGRAYTEDELVGPEYARLRECVNEYKRSIQRYP